MTKNISLDASNLPPECWEEPSAVLRPWLVTAPDEDGEQTGRCPLHDDRNPSLSINFERGVWTCHSGCGGGHVRELVRRIASGDATGTPPKRQRLKPAAERALLPSLATIDGWHERLMTDPAAKDARHYLEVDRNLDEPTIKAAQIGWDGDRLTFPVFAHGELVNVRMRRPGKNQPMIGLKGHSTKVLYPDVDEVPDEGRVFIPEGELDALVLRAHGFQAFTAIGGAGVLPGVIEKHVDVFVGLDVVVWTDADDAGRNAAEGVAHALEAAGTESTVLSPQGVPESFDASDACRRWGRDFRERVEMMLSDPPPESAYDREVREAIHRLRVQEEARRRLALERARELGSAPPALEGIPTAAEWFAEPDEDPEYVVDTLIELGHNVMVGGQAKSGKTTLIIDLVTALTRGESTWLGEYPLSLGTGRVGWINYEMSERQVRRWMRGVESERFAILNARGNGPNLLDPEWWTFLRDWLVRESVTFLVLDSLTEMVTSAGLDEDKDGVAVLAALDRLRGMTPLSEVIVIAHFGHSGERVRGTSKFGGWVDATFKVIRDEKPGHPDRRYLSGFGRDVDLHESELMRDGTGRLMIQPGISRQANKTASTTVAQERKEAEAEELRSLALRTITEQPGIGSTALREAVQDAWRERHDQGVGSTRLDEARTALIEDNTIRVEGGGRGSGKTAYHYVNDAPEATP
jgi:hypothetical protein